MRFLKICENDRTPLDFINDKIFNKCICDKRLKLYGVVLYNLVQRLI